MTIDISLVQSSFASAAFSVSTDATVQFTKYDIRVVPLEFTPIGSDALATTVNMQGLNVSCVGPSVVSIPINADPVKMPPKKLYKATIRLYSGTHVDHTKVGVFYYDTRTFTVDPISVSNNPNPNYPSDSSSSVPNFSHPTPVIKVTDYETDPGNALTVTLDPSGNGNDDIFTYVKFDKVCMSCTDITDISFNTDKFKTNDQYYLGEQSYVVDPTDTYTYNWELIDAGNNDTALPTDSAFELWGNIQLALSDSFASLVPDTFVTPTFSFGFDIVASNDTVGYNFVNPEVTLTMGDVVGTVSDQPIKITLTNLADYTAYKFTSITLNIRESGDLSSPVLVTINKNGPGAGAATSDFGVGTLVSANQVVITSTDLSAYVNDNDTTTPIVNLVNGQEYHFEIILNFENVLDDNNDLYFPYQYRSVVKIDQFDDSLDAITTAHVVNSWQLDSSEGAGLVVSFKKTDQFLGSSNVPYNLDMHGATTVLAEYSITHNGADWTTWLPLTGGSITQQANPDYALDPSNDGIYTVPQNSDSALGPAQPYVNIYAVIPNEQANYKLVKVRLTLSTNNPSYSSGANNTSETHYVAPVSTATYPIANASVRYFPEADVHSFVTDIPFITAINGNADDGYVADFSVPVSVNPYFQAVVTSNGSGVNFGSANPYDYDAAVPAVDNHDVTGLSYPISFVGDDFVLSVKYVYLENTSIETAVETKTIKQQGLLPITDPSANVVNSWQLDSSEGAGLVVSFKKTDQFLGSSNVPYNLDMHGATTVLAEYSITHNGADWTTWTPLTGGSITQQANPVYELDASNTDGKYAVPQSRDSSVVGAAQPTVKIYAVIPGQVNYNLVKIRLTLSTASSEYTPLIDIDMITIANPNGTVADPPVPIGTSETYDVPIQANYSYPIADASFRYFPKAPVHNFVTDIPFITAINGNADDGYVADFSVPVSVNPYFQAVVTSNGSGVNFGSANPYDYDAAVPAVDNHDVTGLSYPISFVGDDFVLSVKYVYLENTSIETAVETKTIKQQGLLPITDPSANVVNSWQLDSSNGEGLVVSFSKTAQFMGNSAASYNLDLAGNQATVLAEYSITHNGVDWTGWLPLAGGSIAQQADPVYVLDETNDSGIYNVPQSSGSALGPAQSDVKIYAVIPGQVNYNLVKIRLTLSTASSEYTPLIDIDMITIANPNGTVADPPVPIGTSETYDVAPVSTATYPTSDASVRYFPEADVHSFADTYKPEIASVDASGNVHFIVPVTVPPYFSSSVTTSGGTVNGTENETVVSNSNGNSNEYLNGDVSGLSYAPTVAGSFQLTVAYTSNENTAIYTDDVSMTVQMQGLPSDSFTVTASSWDSSDQLIHYTLSITAASTTADRMDGWNMYIKRNGDPDTTYSSYGNLLLDAGLSQSTILNSSYDDYTKLDVKFVATRSIYLASNETADQVEGGEVAGATSDIEIVNIVKLPETLPPPTSDDIVVANLVHNTLNTSSQSGTLTVAPATNVAQITITDPASSTHTSSSSSASLELLIGLTSTPTALSYSVTYDYDQYLDNDLVKLNSAPVTVTFTTGTSTRIAPVLTAKTLLSDDDSFDLTYTSSNTGTPNGDISSVAYVKHASADAVSLVDADGTGNVGVHQGSEVVLHVIDKFNTDYDVDTTSKQTADQDIQSPDSLTFYLAANPTIDEESIVVVKNSTQSLVRFSVNNNGAPVLHQVVLAMAQDSSDIENDAGFYALAIFTAVAGFVAGTVVSDTLNLGGSAHTLTATSIPGTGMDVVTNFEFASSLPFSTTAANIVVYVKNNTEGADSASFGDVQLTDGRLQIVNGTVKYTGDFIPTPLPITSNGTNYLVVPDNYKGVILYDNASTGQVTYQGITYPFNNLVTTLVTTMSGMFFNSQFNQSISSWDTSNVTDMNSMFFNSHFNQSISSWNTSNVTDMNSMFYGSQFNQSISSWNTSNVTNMAAMFYGTAFNQPIHTIGNSWNTSNVTNMTNMFAHSQFNQPIGNWNTSNVINMDYMFFEAAAFNQYIVGWNVTNVITKPPTDFNGGSSVLTSANSPVWI